MQWSNSSRIASDSKQRNLADILSINRRNFLKGVAGIGALAASSPTTVAAPQRIGSPPRAFKQSALHEASQAELTTPDNIIELADGRVLVTADLRYLVTH
jgi:hypothetical protein